jgi:hypothetical protein
LVAGEELRDELVAVVDDIGHQCFHLGIAQP